MQWVLLGLAIVLLLVICTFCLRDMRHRGRPVSTQVVFVTLCLVPGPLMLGLGYWLYDRFRHPFPST